MTPTNSQPKRATHAQLPFVLLVASSLVAIGCGGVNQDDCEALEPGMSRADVEDEVGEPAFCSPAPVYEQGCRANDPSCGPLDNERCDCLLTYSVATDKLKSASWICQDCHQEIQ